MSELLYSNKCLVTVKEFHLLLSNKKTCFILSIALCYFIVSQFLVNDYTSERSGSYPQLNSHPIFIVVSQLNYVANLNY